MIIYLFGDARQLYPYELARPTISAPTPLPVRALASRDIVTPSGVTLPMVALTKNSESKFKVEPTDGRVPEAADVDDGASDKGTYPDADEKITFILDFDAIIPPYTAINNGSGLGRGVIKSLLKSFASDLLSRNRLRDHYILVLRLLTQTPARAQCGVL